MNRFISIAFLICSLASCTNNATAKKIEIIIYSDFIGSNEIYCKLIDDFEKSDLVDSVRVIGRPIRVNVLEFKIDSLKVQWYGVDFERLQAAFDTIKQLKTANSINSQLVMNESGTQVPVVALADIYLQLEDYKPEIFLKTPEVFFYKDEVAVKVELFFSRNNKKELVEFVKNQIFSYSDLFETKLWRFEIIK